LYLHQIGRNERLDAARQCGIVSVGSASEEAMTKLWQPSHQVLLQEAFLQIEIATRSLPIPRLPK